MHEERNDAIKQNNKLAIQRYKFAAECVCGSKKILDVACGMGYGTSILKGINNIIAGIDKSKEAIEYAKINYPMAEYKVVDVEKDEFDYSVFDAVVCLEVLSHLERPREFINKLKVKELVISSPINPNPNDGYKYRLHNLNEFLLREMLKDWDILKVLSQKDKYLVLYCKRKNI